MNENNSTYPLNRCSNHSTNVFDTFPLVSVEPWEQKNTNHLIQLTVPEILSFYKRKNTESLLKYSIRLGDLTSTRILFKYGAKLEKISQQDFERIAYEFLRRIDTRKSMLLLLLEHGLENVVEEHWKGEINLLNIFLTLVTKYDEDAVEVTEIILNSRLSSRISEFDRDGTKTLMSAIPSGNIDLVSFLIDLGANVRQTNKYEPFPLWLAVTCDHMNIMNLLISNGADVSAKRFDGYTVLHEACKLNLTYVIEYLLDKGADPCAQTSDGVTPLSLLIHFHLGRCNEALVVMMKKLSRLSFENRPIPKSDMNLIRKNPKARKHFEKCTAELKKMAVTPLWGSQTLHSLLKMNSEIKKLSSLAKNVDHLSKILDICCRFSYFRRDLILKLAGTVKVWNDTLIVEVRLNPLFKDLLPWPIIKKLSENLTVDDLPSTRA